MSSSHSDAATPTVRQQVAAELIEEAFSGQPVLAPSLCVAVFDRSGVLATRVSGRADAAGTPSSPETVYRIASMSKSFCAAAVLMLVEQGLLGLDDPVSRHVPGFRSFVDADGTEWPVTVRMLLTNSSGLPEDNAWADSQLAIGREELLTLIGAGVRFGERPGTSYQYSNLGWGLLGLVVEEVTGRRFTDVVEERILRPLGLAQTRYRREAYPEGTPLAVGFSTFDRGATWVQRPYVGDGALAVAGGLFSTLSDVARWSAWLSGAFEAGSVADPVGLSAQSRRQLQTLATAVHSDARLGDASLLAGGYGMGLVVELHREHGVFAQHSGGLPGFSSHMRWHTDSGLGVVAFANADGASLSVGSRELLNRVLARLGTPSRRVQLWPATKAAAVRVDEMLRTGADHERCADLFSGNVASEVPLALRRERAVAVFEGLGGVRPSAEGVSGRVLFAEAASGVAWRIPCRDGDAIARIEMTPLADTRVQRLVVEPVGGPDVQPDGMLGGFVAVW